MTHVIGKHAEMKTLLINTLFILLINTLPQSALAIVNLDNLHLSSTNTGTSGKLKLNLSGDEGNNQNFRVKGAGILNYRTVNALSFLHAEHTYGESFGEENKNKSFVHARYIRDVSRTKAWEIFAQIEQNKFARLNYRGLIGSGLRFDLSDNNKSQRLFLGTGAFYSQEEISNASTFNEEKRQNFLRANVYLIYQKNLSENVSFYSTTYFQPAIDDPEDFRALEVAGLKTKLLKNLNLVIALEGAFDNHPPEEVDRKDIAYSTGIEYSF